LRETRQGETPIISTPVGSAHRFETPAERIERYLAGPMIAADDEQLLARSAIPPRRLVVHAVIADVQAVDDGVAERPPLWMILPHMHEV
jgi:hypothetical protein